MTFSDYFTIGVALSLGHLFVTGILTLISLLLIREQK